MHANHIGKQAIRRWAIATASLSLMAISLAAQAPAAPRVPGQNPNGMRVFLWTGLKTHEVGQHDYPQFLADWS